MSKVDPDDPRPPFQQVADALRDVITRGDIAPGERLPKQSELAAEYGVSVGTVKSGLSALRDQGLVVSRQGEGSWVRKSLPEAPDDADEQEGSGPEGADVRSMLAEVLERLDAIERRLDGEANQL